MLAIGERCDEIPYSSLANQIHKNVWKELTLVSTLPSGRAGQGSKYTISDRLKEATMLRRKLTMSLCLLAIVLAAGLFVAIRTASAAGGGLIGFLFYHEGRTVQNIPNTSLGVNVYSSTVNGNKAEMILSYRTGGSAKAPCRIPFGAIVETRLSATVNNTPAIWWRPRPDQYKPWDTKAKDRDSYRLPLTAKDDALSEAYEVLSAKCRPESTRDSYDLGWNTKNYVLELPAGIREDDKWRFLFIGGRSGHNERVMVVTQLQFDAEEAPEGLSCEQLKAWCYGQEFSEAAYTEDEEQHTDSRTTTGTRTGEYGQTQGQPYQPQQPQQPQGYYMQPQGEYRTTQQEVKFITVDPDKLLAQINARFEQVQTVVNAHGDSIDGLNTSVATLNAQMSQVNATLNQYGQRLTALESKPTVGTMMPAISFFFHVNWLTGEQWTLEITDQSGTRCRTYDCGGRAVVPFTTQPGEGSFTFRVRDDKSGRWGESMTVTVAPALSGTTIQYYFPEGRK